MTIKNRDQLIPWREVRKEAFTKRELRILDARHKLKNMLRRLREERKKHKLTQAKLAEKAFLPRTTVTKIETGYQNVSLFKIMQLADAMDMMVEINLVPIKKSR